MQGDVGPVYLFGSTRSGTTWLQNLLGSHPSIATPQELDLFSQYIAPLRQAWESQMPVSAAQWHRHRYKGLPSILTEQAFDALVTEAIERVYESILEAKPGSTIILEKVPGYGGYVPLIVRHMPNACFLHLIRDGRDVVASLQRASTGWGRGWAASSAQRGALSWRTYVERGRAAGQLVPKYLELRYERLASPDGPEVLQGAFAFCGVEVSLDEARATLERFALVADGPPPPSSIVWGGEVRRQIRAEPSEPDGFFGEGVAGTWKTRLGAFDRWSIEREAGALLRELGYERDASWTTPGVWRLLGPLRLAFTVAWPRLRAAAGAARRVLTDDHRRSRAARADTGEGATA
jgi:hypothetical protein